MSRPLEPRPLNIQPMVVEETGSNVFLPDRDTFVTAQMDYAQRVLALAGVRLNVKPTVVIEDEPLKRPRDVFEPVLKLSDYPVMAREEWERDHTVLVVYVRSMVDPFGFMYYGETNFASHLVVVTSFSPPPVTAHELGHLFDLKHSWEDSLVSDPPCDLRECEGPCGDNIMSYCENPDRPIANTLTPKQINAIKKSPLYHLLVKGPNEW